MVTRRNEATGIKGPHRRCRLDHRAKRQITDVIQSAQGLIGGYRKARKLVGYGSVSRALSYRAGGWVPRGRHALSVVAVGETIVQGPRAAYALVSMKSSWGQGEQERSDCRWGLGSAEGSPLVRIGSTPTAAPLPEGCNGRAQRLPCQDRRGTTTHILRSA